MYRGNSTVRTMPVLLVALALNASVTDTDVVTADITHSSTMSGGSRLSAAGGSGQSGGAEGSEGCHCRAGGIAGGEAAEDVVRWVMRVFTACLQARKSRCAWQLTRSVSWPCQSRDC